MVYQAAYTRAYIDLLYLIDVLLLLKSNAAKKF